MYPPPPPSGLEKLKEVRATPDVPPPRNGKVEISGHCDILDLVDVALPPGMGKLKSQVNVTFLFWLMYPPTPPKD